MKILIVALEYLEPEWEQTMKCIKATGLDYNIVSRDGVGNMSRAFNHSMVDIIYSEYDLLWFITNITFDNSVPFDLASSIGNHAAIHPSFRSSDHRHQWPDGSKTVKEVPFIELTAPMIKSWVFAQQKFDEMLPYYYMDLDYCYRLKQSGKTVAVHHGAEINHVYLRNNTTDHPISKIRKQLRHYWTPISKAHMVKKWGEDWETKLWPK